MIWTTLAATAAMLATSAAPAAAPREDALACAALLTAKVVQLRKVEPAPASTYGAQELSGMADRWRYEAVRQRVDGATDLQVMERMDAMIRPLMLALMTDPKAAEPVLADEIIRPCALGTPPAIG